MFGRLNGDVFAKYGESTVCKTVTLGLSKSPFNHSINQPLEVPYDRKLSAASINLVQNPAWPVISPRVQRISGRFRAIPGPRPGSPELVRL